ncbi:MAG: ferredoxin [Bacilli bacterium]|nr:ferredoxin [Bacilli bacterium]
MKKIIVNTDICIGCGACTAIASEVFEFDDNGYAKALETNDEFEKLNDENKEAVTDALEGCPVGAIYIEEKEI